MIGPWLVPVTGVGDRATGIRVGVNYHTHSARMTYGNDSSSSEDEWNGSSSSNINEQLEALKSIVPSMSPEVRSDSTNLFSA